LVFQFGVFGLEFGVLLTEMNELCLEIAGERARTMSRYRSRNHSRSRVNTGGRARKAKIPIRDATIVEILGRSRPGRMGSRSTRRATVRWDSGA